MYFSDFAFFSIFMILKAFFLGFFGQVSLLLNFTILGEFLFEFLFFFFDMYFCDFHFLVFCTRLGRLFSSSFLFLPWVTFSILVIKKFYLWNHAKPPPRTPQTQKGPVWDQNLAPFLVPVLGSPLLFCLGKRSKNRGQK